MEKKWYQSKTIIASLIAGSCVIAGFFGVDIGADEQTALVDVALQAVAVAASGVAIYGRVKASYDIK